MCDEQIYNKLVELIQEASKNKNFNKNEFLEEWIKEFNKISLELEQNRNENLPSETETLAWEAKIINNKTYLISPPMIYKHKGIQLGFDLANPSEGTHINCVGYPFPAVNSHYTNPCLTSSDLGATSEGIFPLWDYIAREGVEKCLNAELITNGWVTNVFDRMPNCQKEVYELIGTYKNRLTGKKNQEILELERLCRAHNISSDMIHGEGSRDKQGRYYNSWFNQNICTACNRAYRSPSYKYPNSFLSHVKSIKHRKNASELLLKQRIQNYNQN